MRRLLIIFALSMFVLLFTSCESNVGKGRSAYKEYFKQVLKDPKSLTIHNEEYVKKDDNSIEWTLDIGAKNSYGGVVREKYIITTYEGSRVLFVQGKGPYNLGDKK